MHFSAQVRTNIAKQVLVVLDFPLLPRSEWWAFCISALHLREQSNGAVPSFSCQAHRTIQ
jgi:hypothetical protein